MTKDKRTTKKAIDFKSATLDTVRLVLRSSDTGAVLNQLEAHLKQSQGFFAGEPVVIDATQLENPIQWKALADILKKYQLHPIGIVASKALKQEEFSAFLPSVSLSIPLGRNNEAPTPSNDQTESEQATAPVNHSNKSTTETNHPPQYPPTSGHLPTKIIERQLRSGQRVYAKNSDLIVVGVVGQGAEIIADGNIHVYGPLRGRAMAGANGNHKARIFTTEFEPELVAIAGVYKVFEQKLPDAQYKQPAIIYLDHENLNIDSIR